MSDSKKKATRKYKQPKTEPPKDHSEFSAWFVDEYSRQIAAKASRHAILNRYSTEDIKHYMVERILEILNKREKDGNPIEEPKIYFRKLISFWCVEYQRMNGYIFGLPKRPRCPDAENKICSYGFTYLKTQQNEEDKINAAHVSKLSYIDVSITEPTQYYSEIVHKGDDNSEKTEVWDALMDHLKDGEVKVIEYIYKYNLTATQVAKELDIGVSTVYQRKAKALATLSGFIVSRSNNDSSSWHILNSIF